MKYANRLPSLMNLRILLILVMSLSLSAVNRSFGASSVTRTLVNNGGGTDVSGAVLDNTVTNDIKVNAMPGQSIGTMQVFIQLSSGHFFEHPYNVLQPPTTGFIGAAPKVEFDSFLAAGFAIDFPEESFDQPLIQFVSGSLGEPVVPGPPVTTATQYNAKWDPPLGQQNAGSTNYLAGRFTLSNDAHGVFRFQVDFSDNTSLAFKGTTEVPIANGIIGIVPEPTSFGLIVCAMNFVLIFSARNRHRAQRGS